MAGPGERAKSDPLPEGPDGEAGVPGAEDAAGEVNGPGTDDDAADAIAEFDDMRTAVTEDRQLPSDKLQEIKLREKIREAMESMSGDEDEE